MNGLNFGTIDVEAANADRSTICQIGIVHVRDRQVRDRWVSLVDPEDWLDAWNIAIHGLSAEVVKGAPTLPALDGELRARLGTSVVYNYAGETEQLRRALSHHLRDRRMPDRDNWRLQNEPGWHDDRGILLRFLDAVGIEPTNNRAERALRGPVITRKVSHCSKTEGVRSIHERNQDPGSEGWWSVGGGWSVRCVQRRACPRPLHLNLFPTSPPPIINYDG